VDLRHRAHTELESSSKARQRGHPPRQMLMLRSSTTLGPTTSYANGWMRRSHSCPRSSARRWSYAIARATRANKLQTVLVAL
jgi:hypothetical protein